MEVITFNFLGLQLQEPISILSNGILVAFCLYAFIHLKDRRTEPHNYWRLFFLILGISTFFGIFGHLFFHYLGFPGKYPSWVFGALANGIAAASMFKFTSYSIPSKVNLIVIWIKGLVFLTAAIVTNKFLFIALDSIVTYLLYIGLYSLVLIQRDVKSLKWMIYGVVILVPSAFIFILNINLSIWFNKNDLSHVFMLGTLVCFYIGINNWYPPLNKNSVHV